MAAGLRFRTDGTLTIVQFADTHFKNGEPADEQTTALMEAVLDAEQPDLVVFTGDQIDGKYCVDPAASLHRAFAPVLARGLAWAAVFGNHDDEGSLDRRSQMALQQSLPGCLAEPGPAEVTGVGNYVLPVQSAAGSATAALLYFLDSNSYSPLHRRSYDWIRRDQIAWYLAEAQRWRAGRAELLPALAFFHIPLPEYNEVWDLYPCVGVKHEPVGCALFNSGFFAALYEAGDVLGAFVGHDHINDFIGNLHGIRLVYGRGSGFNTYGRAGFAHGARVIRLNEGVRDFVTWMRLEDGTTITDQPAHAPEVTRAICML
jgi:hypothetical protein